jgi:hypothetical protein
METFMYATALTLMWALFAAYFIIATGPEVRDERQGLLLARAGREGPWDHRLVDVARQGQVRRDHRGRD